MKNLDIKENIDIPKELIKNIVRKLIMIKRNNTFLLYHEIVTEEIKYMNSIEMFINCEDNIFNSDSKTLLLKGDKASVYISTRGLLDAIAKRLSWLIERLWRSSLTNYYVIYNN